jgi:hypothetical protein
MTKANWVALVVLALTWGRWVQHWMMSEFTVPWLPVLASLVVWGIAVFKDALDEVYSLVARPVGRPSSGTRAPSIEAARRGRAEEVEARLGRGGVERAGPGRDLETVLPPRDRGPGDHGGDDVPSGEATMNG